MTSIHLAKPEAEKTNNRFFNSDDEGISYSTVEEIAQFLYRRSNAVLVSYGGSMISLASVHCTWGDFRGMRETLNFLVDVRIRVAELRGEEHLS